MEQMINSGTISKITSTKDRETWFISLDDGGRVIVDGVVAIKKIAQAFDIDTTSDDFPGQMIGKKITFITNIFSIMEKFLPTNIYDKNWIQAKEKIRTNNRI